MLTYPLFIQVFTHSFLFTDNYLSYNFMYKLLLSYKIMIFCTCIPTSFPNKPLTMTFHTSYYRPTIVYQRVMWGGMFTWRPVTLLLTFYKTLVYLFLLSHILDTVSTSFSVFDTFAPLFVTTLSSTPYLSSRRYLFRFPRVSHTAVLPNYH